jgi:hypothetical protein
MANKLSEISETFVSETDREESIRVAYLNYVPTDEQKSTIPALKLGGEIKLGFGQLCIYKQTFKTKEYVVGPIEVVTAIGPGETLEVSITVQRETTQETSQTDTQESSIKSSSSQQIVNDLSNKLTKSYTESASLKLGGGTPVVNGSLSVSKTKSEVKETINKLTTTSAESVERQMRNSTQITTRKATRDYQEESSRRMIQNLDTDKCGNQTRISLRYYLYYGG